MKDGQSPLLIMPISVVILLAGPIVAQTFPERPMTFVVGYTAGGGSDTVARYFAEKTGSILGQRVIVENRPGANGNIATSAVARAVPDGHTFLLGNIGPIAVNPSLYPTMRDDPQKTLTPITQIAGAPLAILVNADLPAKSLRELVAYAKERPGKLNYASAGAGTSNQLAAELLNLRAGIKTFHIPYRGAAQAMTALLTGDVSIFVAPLPSAMPHVQSGKIRALAVTSAERVAAMPDVPTAAETGFDGVEMTTWYGVLAPKATPEPIINQLNAAFRKALSEANTRTWLANDGGAQPIGSSPEEFAAFIRRETVKWAEVVKAASISID